MAHEHRDELEDLSTQLLLDLCRATDINLRHSDTRDQMIQYLQIRIHQIQLDQHHSNTSRSVVFPFGSLVIRLFCILIQIALFAVVEIVGIFVANTILNLVLYVFVTKGNDAWQWKDAMFLQANSVMAYVSNYFPYDSVLSNILHPPPFVKRFHNWCHSAIRKAGRRNSG